jgi:hypothetical protein
MDQIPKIQGFGCRLWNEAQKPNANHEDTYNCQTYKESPNSHGLFLLFGFAMKNLGNLANFRQFSIQDKINKGPKGILNPLGPSH